MAKDKPDNLKWKVHLTPDQYAVCWDKATEPPFSGEYNYCNDSGIYKCVCCENSLFSSVTKYDSGTGWPSFYAPIKVDSVKAVKEKTHRKLVQEVICGNCSAHLGHLFHDGPQPTGLRYCINSLALKLARGKIADFG